MKKIKRGYIEDFKPVILYLDDLEEIVEILKELPNKVRILADDYELDSLDELQKINRDRLDMLIIKVVGPEASSPYISLNFLPNDILFEVDEDTAAKRGIVEKIKEFLKGRRRKLFWLTGNHLLAGATTGMSIWFFMPGKILLGCAVLSLGLIWSWWSFKLRDKKWSVIHLKRRSDSPSFWKRNKDEIAIVVITAIISIVFTSIINWLIFPFFKKP